MNRVVGVQLPALAKTRLFQFPLVAVLLLVTGLLLNLLNVKAPSFVVISMATAGIGTTIAAEFAPRPNQRVWRFLLQYPIVIIVIFATLAYCENTGEDSQFMYIGFLTFIFLAESIGSGLYRVRQAPPWKWQRPWTVIPVMLIGPLFAVVTLVFGFAVFDYWPVFVITASLVCVAGCGAALCFAIRRQSLLEGRQNLIG